jgi:hypothetical protein
LELPAEIVERQKPHDWIKICSYVRERRRRYDPNLTHIVLIGAALEPRNEIAQRTVVRRPEPRLDFDTDAIAVPLQDKIYPALVLAEGIKAVVFEQLKYFPLEPTGIPRSKVDAE